MVFSEFAQSVVSQKNNAPEQVSHKKTSFAELIYEREVDQSDIQYADKLIEAYKTYDRLLNSTNISLPEFQRVTDKEAWKHVIELLGKKYSNSDIDWNAEGTSIEVRKFEDRLSMIIANNIQLLNFVAERYQTLLRYYTAQRRSEEKSMEEVEKSKAQELAGRTRSLRNRLHAFQEMFEECVNRQDARGAIFRSKGRRFLKKLFSAFPTKIKSTDIDESNFPQERLLGLVERQIQLYVNLWRKRSSCGGLIDAYNKRYDDRNTEGMTTKERKNYFAQTNYFDDIGEYGILLLSQSAHALEDALGEWDTEMKSQNKHRDQGKFIFV